MNRPKIALEPTMVLFAPVMTVECPYYTLMLTPTTTIRFHVQVALSYHDAAMPKRLLHFRYRCTVV